MNLPADEPKDGDFVAYLAQIERQQLEHLAPIARAAPTEAARRVAPAQPAPSHRAAAAAPAMALGSVVLAAIGLFLLLFGLVGNGGWIAAAVGAFLLWRAAKSLSTALRNPSPDLRAPLDAKIAAGRKRA